MKRPGLTPAMRRALEMFPATTADWFHRLLGQGLIEAKSPFDALRQMDHQLSPRGHAALAAEPMTQGEYECMRALEQCEKRKVSLWHEDGQWTRGYKGLARKGWAYGGELTPAGRTQLNNIRAAMPGPWVPHSHSDATNTDEG